MFLHINLCQILILKINSISFFLQKSETQSYCRLLHLFELNQIKPNSVVGLQSLINILWTHRLLMVSALWQMHRPTRPIRCRPHKAFVNLRPSLELYGKMYRPTRPIRYRPLQAFANLRPSLEICGKCTGRPGPSDVGLYRPLVILAFSRPIRCRPIQAFGYFWPSLGPQNFMANHKYRPLQAYENFRYFHISNKLRSLSRPIRYIILYRPP